MENYAVFYLQKELHKHNLYIKSIEECETIFSAEDISKSKLISDLKEKAKQIERAITKLSKEV